MNTWHIYNEGNNVLFRNNADRIYFNNKFAAISYDNSVEVLAKSELSTHFHSVAGVLGEEHVLHVTSALKASYGLYYRHKYGATMGDNFKVKCDKVSGKENILNKLVYVMANSAHHYITESPFTWQFSSANYIFTQDYMPLNYRKALASYVVPLGSMSSRRRKDLLGKVNVPDEWLVDPEGFVLPSSFIDVQKVRAFFSGSFRQFRYLLDTSVRDSKGDKLNEMKQSVMCDGMNDDVVCDMIDRFAISSGRKSFHFFSEMELRQILSSLMSHGVPFEQCRRCLWLPNESAHF